MKKAYILLAGILLSLSAISQNVPQKMSYQSVIRNSNNELVVNQSCSVSVKIIKVTSSGNQNVYVENHSTVFTNANGLLSLQIGSGLTTDSFSEINWSDGPYLIETTTTPLGDNAIVTQSELLTVPYAISAANGVPVGTIISFGGNTIPAGYLECNGEPKLITDYPALANVLGDFWGPSSSTFTLPDLRGYFLRGVSGTSGNDPDVSGRIGNGGANAVGSKQTDAFKTHTHTESKQTTGAGVDVGGYNWNVHQTTGETAATGGNETRPKNAYVRYIIKY